MILDMPRPRPPHLQHEKTRHGNYVWVVRIGKGPRTRLKAAYGTPEFDAEYQAAVTGQPLVSKPGASKASLQWLWDSYRETGAWSGLVARLPAPVGQIVPGVHGVGVIGSQRPLAQRQGHGAGVGVGRRRDADGETCIPGVRVAPLIPYPYKVFYRNKGEAIEILYIHHVAQDEPRSS